MSNFSGSPRHSCVSFDLVSLTLIPRTYDYVIYLEIGVGVVDAGLPFVCVISFRRLERSLNNGVGEAATRNPEVMVCKWRA